MKNFKVRKILFFGVIATVIMVSSLLIYTNLKSLAFSDGSLDSSFVSGSGVNNFVYSAILQPDEKIVVVGFFTTYNGVAKNYIVRLNPDGTIDNTFNLGGSGPNNFVYSVNIQPDGKIIIGGDFTTYNGTPITRIARLNPNGTLDTSFNPGSGVSDDVYAIGIQTDGKIVIGGWFQFYNGVLKNRITRLNSDGTIDSSFNSGSGATGGTYVSYVRIQSDGKIIIAGDFTSYDGTSRGRIARLNSDGTIDTSFDPGLGANSNVRSAPLQPDGKIIIAGHFTSYNGVSRNHIARLNSDGSLDLTFDPGTGANNNAYYFTPLQPDGKIIIAGDFTSYNGVSRNRIARLNSDGSLDLTFDPGTGANDGIYSTIMHPSGKIIIGGAFTTYNGVTKNRIARLDATDLWPPTVSELTPVSSPTSDTTPNYTFNTTESGTIAYGGSCSSSTITALIGTNTISFNTLPQGTYSDCTITVTDASSNVSNTLNVSTFTIDTIPELSETTPIGTSVNNFTPSYTFNTTEAGDITFGGSCSSSTTTATLGSNTITLNTLNPGIYNNCTITVTDSNGNISTPLTISQFSIVVHSGGSSSPSPAVTETTNNESNTTPDNTNNTLVNNTENTSIPTLDINDQNNNQIIIEPTIGVIPVSNTYISPLDNTEKICQPFTTYLRKGNITNNKDQVRLWQAFLNKYEKEILKIDGIFGNNTENAIKRFQSKHKDYILTPWNLTNPTGYTYQTTRAYGNKVLGCSEGEVRLDNGRLINY